jgi:hypothetical protein
MYFVDIGHPVRDINVLRAFFGTFAALHTVMSLLFFPKYPVFHLETKIIVWPIP